MSFSDIEAVREVGVDPMQQLTECAARLDDRLPTAPLTGSALSLLRPPDTGHTHMVNGACFSPDSRLLCTVSYDQTAILWAPTQAEGPGGAATWRQVQVLSGHRGSVTGACFAPDSSLLCTVSFGQPAVAVLWAPTAAGGPGGAATWEQVQVLSGNRGPVWGACFAPSCSLLCTANEDNTAVLWAPTAAEGPGGAATWGQLQVLTGHKRSVLGACFAPDSSLLCTASADKTAVLWAPTAAEGPGGAATWEQLQVLSGHKDWVRGACFAPDSSLLCTASDDATAVLWAPTQAGGPGGAATWGQVQTLSGHTGQVLAAAFMESPEHTREGELGIATASVDKTCILWRWDGRLAYKDVHIRRPKNWEVLLPALLLFVGMAQRVGLAVSSELPWDGRVVRPVRMTFGVTLFDLELSVDPTVQMYAKVCTAIAVLLVHLVCAAAGKGAPVVKLTSTVLVVPLVKILVTAFDCSHGLYGHLDSAPEVACFDGWHLVLAVSTGVVGFCYVATLIPLTLVEGDLASLPKHIWFQPRQWVKRKIAKTQGLDIGWLQPAVRGTVPNAMVEFASLLLLPANAILSSSHPARHALCSLLVCSTSLLSALAFPPKAKTKANYLVQGANAISVVAWSAASLSVYLPGSLAAPCLLYGGMSTVLITVCFLLARPVYVGMSLAPSASDEQAVAFLGEV